MTIDCEGDQVIISATPISHDWFVRLKLDFNLGFLSLYVPDIHTSIDRSSSKEVFIFRIPSEGRNSGIMVSQNLLYFLRMEIIDINREGGTESKTVSRYTESMLIPILETRWCQVLISAQLKERSRRGRQRFAYSLLDHCSRYCCAPSSLIINDNQLFIHLHLQSAPRLVLQTQVAANVHESSHRIFAEFCSLSRYTANRPSLRPLWL